MKKDKCTECRALGRQNVAMHDRICNNVCRRELEEF